MTEGRCNFVFDDFDFGFFTDGAVVAFFNLGAAADIQADGSIEFQGITAGGSLGAAEHDADFHADLVDKNHQRIGFFDVAGELAQRLTHQPRLQADVAVAHIAFDFSFRHQRRHRVDNHHIDAAAAHQRIADFQRLFAGIGLRQVKLFNVHTQSAGINRIKSMLGVDKGADAAVFLALGDGFQTQGGFTGRLGAKNFDNTATRQTADAQRQVQPQRTGGNHLQVFLLVAAVHFNDGAFAEILFNLLQSRLQGFASGKGFLFCHNVLSVAGMLVPVEMRRRLSHKIQAA